MNIKIYLIILSVAGTLGLPLLSSAQPPVAPEAQVSMVNAFDRDFLIKAFRGGNAEVELGKLAQKKTRNKYVKQFAEAMIWDHGKVNSEVEALAIKNGIELPRDLDAATQKKMKVLAGMEEGAFDKAYIDLMVKDHQTDVAEFEKSIPRLSDSEIKILAEKTLPVLQNHLNAVQMIASP